MLRAFFTIFEILFLKLKLLANFWKTFINDWCRKEFTTFLLGFLAVRGRFDVVENGSYLRVSRLTVPCGVP